MCIAETKIKLIDEIGQRLSLRRCLNAGTGNELRSMMQEIATKAGIDLEELFPRGRTGGFKKIVPDEESGV